MTPILNAVPGSQEDLYTQRHVQARSRIERCFGLLKARWRCLLRDRVLHYHPYMASKICNACCVLHNIALHARLPPPTDIPVGSVGNEVAEGRDSNLQHTTNRPDPHQNELLQGRALRSCLVRRMM